MSDDPDLKVTIEDTDPAERLARHYAPLMVIRGVIGILAGLVLLFWPKTGLAVVAVTLGIFLVADGIERLIAVLRLPAGSGRSDFLSIAGAALRIILGAVLLFNPVGTGSFWASFILIIAGLNLVAGSLLMFWKEPHIKEDLMSAGTAVIMLILGLLMILLPLVTALFMFRILGCVLILSAVPSLAVGLRYRRA
jgi:hypothetical protein